MATVDMWVGAVTHNTVRVRGKVTGTAPRLAVSVSQDLAQPTFTPATSVDAQGVATFDATGLTPGVRYWCAIETSGTVDGLVKGRFRTARGPAGQPESYRFATWTCAGLTPRFPGAQPYTSNHPVLNIITDLVDPDFVVQGGDLHYANIATASAAPYRDAYDAVLHTGSTPNMSRHLRQIPVVYQWDDHDFGPNDSDSTSPGRASAAQVYRERVPHHPLPASGAIYHSFQRGRVLHIVSDVRYDRSPNTTADGPSKTMLGAAQLAWMEDLLSTSTAEFLAWHMPSQWMGTSDDSWAVFSTERRRLVEMLRAPGGDASKGWLHRMIQTSGDVHALAIDDGTGNKWGGFPVIIAASIDSASGSPQDEIYRLGGRYVPTSPGRRRYGVISIDDDGSRIVCTIDAYIGRWRRARHSFTVVTDASASAPSTASTVTGHALVDLGDGRTRVDVESWRVTREIATALPDQIRQVSGVSAASADVVVPAPSGSSMGYWSPWRRGQARTVGRDVELHATVDDETRRVFSGSVAKAEAAARDVSVRVSARDAITRMRQPVAMPAFAAEMGSAKPGASLTWVVEHVLHEYGMSPLPDYLPDPILAAASLAGSLMPNVGSIRPTDTPDNNIDGGLPAFEQWPDLPLPAAAHSRTWITPPEEITDWSTITLGIVVGTGVTEGGSTVRVSIAANRPSGIALFYVWIQQGVDRMVVQLQQSGGDTVAIPGSGDRIDPGLIWLKFRRTGDVPSLEVIQYGQSLGTGTLPAATGLGDPATNIFDLVVVCTGAPALGFQATAQDVPIEALPAWSQDEPAAIIDTATAPIHGVPGVSGTAIDILRDVADAEQGGFWIDEDDKPTFRARAWMRGVGQTPIPVTSARSLVDFSWTETIDQVASAAVVETTRPIATRATATPSELDVYVADQVFRIDPYGTLRLDVDLDQAVGVIERYPRLRSVTGSRFWPSRTISGSSPITSWPSTYAWRYIRLLSATRARVAIRNPYPYPVYLVDDAGDPGLALAAVITVDQTAPVAAVREAGVDWAAPLVLGRNPWRQDITDADQQAIWYAQETTWPRPIVSGVQIVPNMGIRLGSVVDIHDPHVSGMSVQALVRAVSLRASAGQLVQTLDVQPLRVTLAAVDAGLTGTTLGALDAALTGRTLADFDASPLET
ncbi:alkaline phosphatase D family protein [Stackebrandtia soli]|uniref:alkaline phosphatase D family protein n=1 Tax=Stackebrandtia soli TaxID=1892856 RepID=UPI0039E8F834